MKTRIAFILIIIALSGCGNDPKEINVAGHAASQLGIAISNSKGQISNSKHGRIVKYSAKIEGEGITTPIEAEFDGEASEGVIENVPIGENRIVTVRAINPDNLIVREGETGGVSVGGGDANVEVKLDAVPIFTNLSDGNVVENTRLVFQIFSDPMRQLVIQEIGESQTDLLLNADAGISDIKTNESTGLSRFVPLLQSPGKHHYQVRDLDTNKTSEVEIILADGTQIKPAPFVAASALGINEVSVAGRLTAR